MGFPTKEQFKTAIGSLFAFKTLESNQGIIIGEDEIDAYADIGAFLCNEGEVWSAIQYIDGRMRELLSGNPEKYVHEETSSYVRRNAGTLARLEGTVLPEEYVSDNIAKKPKRQSKDQWIGGLEKQLERSKTAAKEIYKTQQESLGKLPGLDGALSLHNDTIVRRFRFRVLLRDLETEILGLRDKGDLFTSDVNIASYIRDGLVWKDSVGFEHGEYTHRLQWLALACHFSQSTGGQAWSKERILTLYRGTTATLKREVYQHFGFQSFGAFSTSSTKAGTTMALPVNLWEFLFDARAARGTAKSTWPDQPGPEVTGFEQYRHMSRSNSFRSPAYMNGQLTKSAQAGLIHAYLATSSIKLLWPHPDRVEKGILAVSKYQEQKNVLFKFTTPGETVLV